MLLSKLLEAIKYNNDVPAIEVCHITNDSREARAGSVFVCIRGFVSDGHIFARGAYERGCRVFVCEYAPDDLPSDATVIFTENTRRALALLSCELYRHPSRDLITIGITGTKGKTTSALMLKQLLDRVGIPAGYIGSNGVIFGECRIDSQNTTPESYVLQSYMRRMVDNGIRAVVMEISSQGLKLERTLGIDFDLTMFTNLSPDHIGPNEHTDFEDYLCAKKKLFDLYSKKHVIANADDPYTERMLEDCNAEKVFYSIDAPSDFKAYDIARFMARGELGMSFICRTDEGEMNCSLSVPGEFNVMNALSVIAAAKTLGVDSEKISDALSKINIEGRFEVYPTPSGASFVIDYAHNGLSLTSALKALREYEPARLICLFGSVGCRTQVRRVQMGVAAAKYADFSILTADNPDSEAVESIIGDIALNFENEDSYIAIPDRTDAIKYAFDIAREGDIILLAGKGHERYQLINGKKLYFCEREIIASLIKEAEISSKA